MTDWDNCPAVWRDPERMSGALCFNGSRLPVGHLFENLKRGATVEQFLEWYPGSSREQVIAVLNHVLRGIEDAAAVMPEQPVLPSADELAEFCQRNGIAKLSLFGSAARDDFGPSSDIDLLVRFCPETKIGIMGVARLENELSPLFGDRKIDLRTIEDLSPYIQDKVLRQARLLVDLENKEGSP